MSADPLYEAFLTLEAELLRLWQSAQLLTPADIGVQLRSALISKIQQQLEHLNYLRETYEGRLLPLREAMKSRPRLRSDYQRLYGAIREGIMHIRASLDVLTRIYGDICSHLIILQRGDEQMRKTKLFLDSYLKEIVAECQTLSELACEQVICLLSREYASTGIFIDEGVFLVSMPIYDLTQLWLWPILSHEIGHMVFYEIHDRLDGLRLLRRIARALRSSAVERRRRDTVSEYIAYWSNYWLREFCADLIGLSLAGPSFSIALMNNLLSHPGGFYTGISPTHPTPEARIAAQMMFLNMIDIPKDLKHAVKARCEALSEGLGRRVGEEADYPFTKDALELVVSAVYRGLNRHPPIVDRIGEIHDCYRALCEGEICTEDPFVLVNSLALLPQKEDLIPKVLEAITADRRSPP